MCATNDDPPLTPASPVTLCRWRRQVATDRRQGAAMWDAGRGAGEGGVVSAGGGYQSDWWTKGGLQCDQQYLGDLWGLQGVCVGLWKWLAWQEGIRATVTTEPVEDANRHWNSDDICTKESPDEIPLCMQTLPPLYVCVGAFVNRWLKPVASI